MSLKGKRIFIIEDNLGNRAIMQLLLERHGAEVWFERWGIDMIERLKSFCPVDLILLDLSFPRGVTGFEIFDQIRAVASLKQIPIVAVSASEPTFTIPRVKEKGFAGFIHKPIHLDKFIRHIHLALEKEAGWIE